MNKESLLPPEYLQKKELNKLNEKNHILQVTVIIMQINQIKILMQIIITMPTK